MATVTYDKASRIYPGSERPAVNELKVFRIPLPNFALPNFEETAPAPAEAKYYSVVFAAAEEGVADWIPFGEMSSGMQRYLSFLIHLSFAPRGTVVLIDELESSLGINCLPAATGFLLRRAPDLQLVLTSHHPYIIEKIPTSYWKIVTRKGTRRSRYEDLIGVEAVTETGTRGSTVTTLRIDREHGEPWVIPSWFHLVGIQVRLRNEIDAARREVGRT